MKYLLTVVFESESEESAVLAFQNAACQLNTAENVQPLEIAHLQAVLNSDMERPTLQTVQTLRPEDFSTWQDVREAQRIPKTIRLANASGLTVRVTIEDTRFTRVVTVAGCTVEQDAIEAVSPYLNSNFLIHIKTEVL